MSVHGFILCYFSSLLLGQENTGLPVYLGYNIAEPNAENLPAIETLMVEPDGLLVGDLGMTYGACDRGWKCFPAKWFEFAVPESCDTGRNGSWEYKGRAFKIVDTITSRAYKKGRKIFVIDIVDIHGVRYGAATYSKERGLESFAQVEKSGASLLVDYHLISDRGAAFGGCLTPGSLAEGS